jgi:hypothetical protein
MNLEARATQAPLVRLVSVVKSSNLRDSSRCRCIAGLVNEEVVYQSVCGGEVDNALIFQCHTSGR